MKSSTLYCWDFIEHEGYPGCCTSCHEDWDEYNYSMVEMEYRGVTAHVCCSVADWLSSTEND